MTAIVYTLEAEVAMLQPHVDHPNGLRNTVKHISRSISITTYSHKSLTAIATLRNPEIPMREYTFTKYIRRGFWGAHATVTATVRIAHIQSLTLVCT